MGEGMPGIDSRTEGEEEAILAGTGALCPDAQADGVPCPELDRDCQKCGRALSPPPPKVKEDPHKRV